MFAAPAGPELPARGMPGCSTCLTTRQRYGAWGGNGQAWDANGVLIQVRGITGNIVSD
jgi:hypothetical protein